MPTGVQLRPQTGIEKAEPMKLIETHRAVTMQGGVVGRGVLVPPTDRLRSSARFLWAEL